jgi:hypothetical protein
VTTAQGIRNELKEKIVQGATYATLSDELKVSKGALWKFINTDYIPTSPTIRHRLGLPELIVQVVVRGKDGRFASQAPD